MHGKVVISRIAKFTRLSANKCSIRDGESMDNDEQQVIIFNFRNEKAKQIFYSILDEPGIANQELSSRFGMDKSTIHDYLNKLYREGLIEFKRDGKFKRYYIKPEVKALFLAE